MKKFLLTLLLLSPTLSFAGLHSEITDGGGFTIVCEEGETGMEIGILVNTTPFGYTIFDSLNETHHSSLPAPTGYGCDDTFYLNSQVLIDLEETGFEFAFIDANFLTNNTYEYFSTFPYQSTIPEEPQGYYPVGTTLTKQNTQNTVLNTLIDWGTNVFLIISAIIVIALAYLIFKFGWDKITRIMNDKDGLQASSDISYDYWYKRGQFEEADGINFIEHTAKDLEFKRNYFKE